VGEVFDETTPTAVALFTEKELFTLFLGLFVLERMDSEQMPGVVREVVNLSGEVEIKSLSNDLLQLLTEFYSKEEKGEI